MIGNGNIKGVILDYGGTIDSCGNHWSEIIYDGYKHVGLDVDKAEFRTSYVYAERYLATNRLIFPQHNFLQLMQIKMRLELDDLLRRGIITEAQTTLTDGIAQYCADQAQATIDSVTPTLQWLHDRYPMALVSNFYGNIESVLTSGGIRHFFRSIIESAVVGVRKPNPAIFQLGVIALGLKPEEVLVVGDSVSKDINPSASLGCHTVWVKGKQWDENEVITTSAPTITSLNQLPALLQD